MLSNGLKTHEISGKSTFPEPGKYFSKQPPDVPQRARKQFLQHPRGPYSRPDSILSEGPLTFCSWARLRMFKPMPLNCSSGRATAGWARAGPGRPRPKCEKCREIHFPRPQKSFQNTPRCAPESTGTPFTAPDCSIFASGRPF